MKGQDEIKIWFIAELLRKKVISSNESSNYYKVDLQTKRSQRVKILKPVNTYLTEAMCLESNFITLQLQE